MWSSCILFWVPVCGVQIKATKMTPKGMIGVIFQIYSPDDDIEDTEGEPASAPVDGNMVEVRRGKVSTTDFEKKGRGSWHV